MAQQGKRPATYADIEAAPEHLVAEIIDGELKTRRHRYFAHAMVRTTLGYALREITQRRATPDAPWHISTMPEVHLGSDVVVPELAAWSVERLPYLPHEHIDIPADWIGELIADDPHGNAALSRKIDLYRKVGVPLMWLIGLRSRKIDAFENDGGRWVELGTWNSDDIVRAPPFDAISFSLADLWPLDPPLGMNEDPTPYYAGDR
jgi:hypothetical protein